MYNTWSINGDYLVYSCGCKFKIKQLRGDNFPLIYVGDPYKDWNCLCSATQMLLGDGRTLGVFQLESSFAQDWCKQLKPENTEHMAALGSILRPGCIQTRDEHGVSTTERYCRYKNGEEVAYPEVPALGPILEDTYYQMLYQEDTMRVATELAGFTGPEANTLMKGIGKKKPEIIAGLRKTFLDGCKKVGKVTEEQAIRIFDNIEKSGRYSFNHCLNPNTLVEKINGDMVTISEINIGDEILSVYGKTKVLNKYNNGIKDVVRITLESGKTIECTLDHKFLCDNGEILPLKTIIENKMSIVTKKDMYGEKIVSIVYVGKIETMDIEVDNNSHTFLANGIETSNSHAVGYGRLGEVTAFAKAHLTEYFYTAYLEGADNKQDPLEERYKLIQDAKFFDIKVTKPDLRYSKPWFYSPKLKSILFGLNSVKSVGKATIKLVKDFCAKESNNWLDILVNCLYKINVKAAQNIIKAGIIENGMTRKRQLHELNILCELTAKGQINWIFDNVSSYTSLKDLLTAMNKPKKEGGGLHSIKDIPKINGLIYTLENPGYSLEDNPEWIASSEEEILGIALSASLLDNVSSSVTNTTCKDLLCGKSTNNMLVKCQIDRVDEKFIKNGKNTGKKYIKLDVSDETGILSGITAWPEVYEKYGYLAKERNTVCIRVYRNKSDSLIINDIYQI